MKESNSYITKDSSLILELINPVLSGNKNLSLAIATVEPFKETKLHIHKNSEEVYFIIQGKGLMTLGNKTFTVKEEDAILIPPKTPHKIKNNEEKELKILCVCSPPYSHEDTELLE